MAAIFYLLLFSYIIAIQFNLIRLIINFVCLYINYPYFVLHLKNIAGLNKLILIGSTK